MRKLLNKLGFIFGAVEWNNFMDGIDLLPYARILANTHEINISINWIRHEWYVNWDWHRVKWYNYKKK